MVSANPINVSPSVAKRIVKEVSSSTFGLTIQSCENLLNHEHRNVTLPKNYFCILEVLG